MSEHDQCGLLESFGLIRNLTALIVKVEKYPDSLHYETKFNTLLSGRWVDERLHLEGVNLTPAVAAALGGLLPKMSSLRQLELIGVNGSNLQAEGMKALFGGLSIMLPLKKLTFRSFSVTGCVAPLSKSLRFFPNLTYLNLEKLNMNNQDLRGLLESFQFIPKLQGLCLSGNSLGHAATSIVPHVITLVNLRYLWIDHSEEDFYHVRDSVQQALPELDIFAGTSNYSGDEKYDFDVLSQLSLFHSLEY